LGGVKDAALGFIDVGMAGRGLGAEASVSAIILRKSTLLISIITRRCQWNTHRPDSTVFDFQVRPAFGLCGSSGVIGLDPLDALPETIGDASSSIEKISSCAALISGLATGEGLAFLLVFGFVGSIFGDRMTLGL